MGLIGVWRREGARGGYTTRIGSAPWALRDRLQMRPIEHAAQRASQGASSTCGSRSTAMYSAQVYLCNTRYARASAARRRLSAISLILYRQST